MVNFQEKVDDLIIVDEEIDLEVRSLGTCAYSAQIFKETLSKIQKSVDDLSLRQYSNLHAWVGKLDEAVEEKLGLRLQVKSFLTFLTCFKIPIIISNLNSNCCNLLVMRNLQEQVKEALCYQKLI